MTASDNSLTIQELNLGPLDHKIDSLPNGALMRIYFFVFENKINSFKALNNIEH